MSSPRAVAAALLMAAVAVFPAWDAHADEPAAEACLACHGNDGVEDARGRALAVVGADAYAASTHADFSCTACHADATEIPHAVPLARPRLTVCATCHASEVEEYERSVHAAADGEHVGEASRCAECHGDLHAVRPHTDTASAAHYTRVALTCARCHADRTLVEKAGIPTVRPVEAYLQSAHARAVAAGKHGAVCADCHGAHEILRGVDPRSSISRGRVPETCGTCHAAVLAEYRGSVHGQAFAHGIDEAPVCTDCHGEHRIVGPAEPASPVFAANIPSETCGRCHGNTRLAEKFGLRVGNVTAFRDSYHGLALRAGKLAVANCSSCHGVHDILPSRDPRSHVNPANLSATCGKCHPGAGTRFELTAVHAVETSMTGRAVWWVRAVYLWLIVLTIGGMAAHDVLDFSRKVRVPSPTPESERMPRALRWQHGLVMVSFPVLVYTGFALTYPERWWAAPLVGWESQFELRGTLHRAAAAILMSALVWHLVHVAVRPHLRACLRGMLPSWRDVRILGGTLAYYVGRRPRAPHSGTFHYAEKVEYWAFLWGMLLMSATGLVLWFENLALHFLPNWTIDIATAIHFYEAVLATLAILVWHLYWVVFDPAVYPMDWTWWTGHAPPARADERRADAAPDGSPPAQGT